MDSRACRHRHGICVPLFSLWTSKGRATFLDLIPLIDWCKTIGIQLIQLLPLNETGDDPSPYNLLSTVDLDPVYITLDAPFHGTRREVKEAKLKALSGQDIQALAYAQMETVKAHATKQGISLMGDLPLLVSPVSKEVREHPEWFDLSFEVGAPPDSFNREGQHWGFPLPRWEKMERYWRDRLKAAERIYHFYRLDHVVGLFRLWAIPPGRPPIEGHFVPENPNQWGPQGRAQLKQLLSLSSMPFVAEDLGFIPPETYEALHEFKIFGTKVMRWQRTPMGGYLDPKLYDPLSLTTLSTPDMEPLALWWERYPLDAIRLCQFKKWHYHPKITKKQQFELLSDSHQSGSLWHVNLLQEYLALFPDLVHETLEEERINIPGTVLPTNWSYRFRPSLEEIISHQPLAEAIRSLLP